jgi:hypothetical protein
MSIVSGDYFDGLRLISEALFDKRRLYPEIQGLFHTFDQIAVC